MEVARQGMEAEETPKHLSPFRSESLSDRGQRHVLGLRRPEFTRARARTIIESQRIGLGKERPAFQDISNFSARLESTPGRQIPH
jgi:hypothetical protein